METVLVEIHNSKAHQLLADLEDLNIIKVIKKVELPEGKLSQKYSGSLSASTAEELLNHISHSRNEWDRHI